MSKVTDIVNGRKEEFLTRVLIATQLFTEKFYTGRDISWNIVTSEAAKAAEAQFNDPESGVYGSTQFAATIKALTGESLQLRAPHAVKYQVGVVVVPVAPAYGKRTDDGYELGKAYLCVNETSGGKFRNAENAAAKMTNGKSNAVGIMSPLSDEVRPATEEEISALVDALFELKALSLLHDLEPELSRYDAFIGK
jgi:hypothetical protein